MLLKKIKLWKYCVLTPVILAPVAASACKDSSKDPYRFAKPTINSYFNSASDQFFSLFKQYIAQQKASGVTVSQDYKGWLEFYNDKNSDLFKNADILVNSYFHNFLATYRSQLATIVSSSTWNNAQKSDFSASLINIQKRFIFLVFSTAVFLKHDFKNTKKTLIEGKYDTSKVLKDKSYIASVLGLFFNQKNEVTADNTKIGSKPQGLFLKQITNFFANDPIKLDKNNLFKLFLNTPLIKNPQFNFNSLTQAAPSSANPDVNFNYNFDLFNYTFKATIAIKYNASTANKFDYSMDEFTITQIK